MNKLDETCVKWDHTRSSGTQGSARCLLAYEMQQRLLFGRVGALNGDAAPWRMLTPVFTYRPHQTRNDLMRHQAFGDRGPQRVVVTGGSGLIGRRLAALLISGGHRVDPLVRRRPRPGTTEIEWDPARAEIDAAALEGADAAIHLAGENIGAGRWTPARKQAILKSRVDGTRLLSEALASLKSPPRVLISASATGYYGDRGDEILNEESEPGTGFLAEVCQQWEAATDAARRAGIRVIRLRIGVVLAAEGGALAAMLTPFKLGVGGVIASGRQFMSWIALDDLVAGIHHLIFAEDVSGPVNAVAPNPVTNADFTTAIGRVLRRPTLLRLPAFGIRLMLGEMAKPLLLEGARVMPAKLEASSFRFLYPDLESALRHELGLAHAGRRG